MPHLRTLAAVAAATVTLLALGACDLKKRESNDLARDTWAAVQPKANTAVSALRDREKVLAGRIAALRLPDGVDDPPLAAAITDLQGSVGKLDDAANGVETALASVSSAVETALAKHDKVAARKVVAAAQVRVDATLAEATAMYDELEPRIAFAEQALTGHTAVIQAEVQGLQQIATAGGHADIVDVSFTDGAPLDVTKPGSKAALDRLVAFAATCAELRFTITGHTAREGDPAQRDALSLARADAVKAYLIAGGVAADKIAATAGAGTSQMAVDEPEPGTAGEQAMPPDELRARRHANRRLTITVVTPCPPPGAAAPTAIPAAAAAAPPAAPTAVPPATPPTRPLVEHP